MRPERTDDSMAAAANGDLLSWQEREADRARGNYPADCRGTARQPLNQAELLNESFMELSFLNRLKLFFEEIDE